VAVGPIGNAIFVNQQTATVASLQGNQHNRFDLQNVMAQAAVNEKEEKVMEVRPAEENHEVDEDRERQKNQADQENKRNPKHEEDEEEEQESTPLHILDIKV
jgi:hypothetical protein